MIYEEVFSILDRYEIVRTHDGTNYNGTAIYDPNGGEVTNEDGRVHKVFYGVEYPRFLPDSKVTVFEAPTFAGFKHLVAGETLRDTNEVMSPSLLRNFNGMNYFPIELVLLGTEKTTLGWFVAAEYQ